MKIKNVVRDYDEVMAMKVPKHFKPKKPNIFWRTLTRVISIPALKKTHYTFREVGMEKLGKKEPALILMNHSSFLDFEIAYYSLYPRRFNTVATLDSFVGLDWIMRQIGCFPTRKFVADLQLIRDIKYCITENKCSVLMYPEAAYSYDGTKTTLPATVAKLVKMLCVPLCMFETFGSYLRDPMYNKLQNRDVPVSAELRYVLSPEQIKEMSADEIQAIIEKEFSFDQYRWQKENNIVIDEPFRADGLESELYKCPHCKAENMASEGSKLFCKACGKVWEMSELGELKAENGETEFSHIPDWYEWERSEVRAEIERGEYFFEDSVEVYSLPRPMKFEKLGMARLSHTTERGFVLSGEYNGEKYEIERHPSGMYGVHIEYDYCYIKPFDCVDISTENDSFYCYPTKQNVVTKLAFATEILYLNAAKQNKKEKA